MKELIITLMYIAVDIPRTEFTNKENFSIFLFPKEKKYIVAPHGALTYYDPTNYIELPDNTDNKEKFMASLLHAYWNADQLTSIARELSEQKKNPPQK